MSCKKSFKVVFWGTYDTGKPRNRILLRGLNECGVTVYQCHKSIWDTIEDKSQITGIIFYLKILLRWFSAYPSLILNYFRQPDHDVIFVGYLGQLDVLILWPFAKLRGKPVILDVFISLYDSVVFDRHLIGPYNPVAWAIYILEWVAFRAVDLVLIDTEEHRQYLIDTFRLKTSRTGKVIVGVEPEFFPTYNPDIIKNNQPELFTFLFYGQFIPLHGISVIIEAARIIEGQPVEIIIIGRGQESRRIREMLDKVPLSCVRWIPWVDYQTLSHFIHSADVCLGIFGDSAKAGRVIPNKVFQILHSGKALITRDSKAIRELVEPDQQGVYLVPPADPGKLAAQMQKLFESGREPLRKRFHVSLQDQITPLAVGCEMAGYMSNIIDC